jgi:hypothetical protein
MLSACGQNEPAQTGANAPPPVAESPQGAADSIPMGTGGRSITSFFVTSVGKGQGGNLGGLAGADAHCQALATAEGITDRQFRAYLSTSATADSPAVNARDRIGPGPWHNVIGELVAMNADQLHGEANAISKDRAFNEKARTVNGAGDTPNMHDILTGSQPDGTAFADGADHTCGNWTSSGEGSAQLGHHDRMGQGPSAASWNSAHASRGCSQADLESTGGAGLFYCFAAD